MIFQINLWEFEDRLLCGSHEKVFTCHCLFLYASFYITLQDVDINLKKTNQESLLEAGGLLLIDESLPSPEVPSLYTRIRSLQRLKVRLCNIFVLFFIIFLFSISF